MSRRLADAVDLVLVAVATAATVYVVVVTLQNPDATSPLNVGELVAWLMLAVVAFVVLLALVAGARLFGPGLLMRWRLRRAIRRAIRHRARRAIRHRGRRIGGRR